MLIDSISGHHIMVWEGILHLTPGLLKMDAECRCYKLNVEHPEAAVLLAEAGVTAERAQHPLLTGIRHDHLLSDQELEGIIGSDRFSFEPYRRNPDWFPGWRDRMAKAADVDIPEHLLEPSIVLLNAGAHWKSVQLGNLTDDDLLDTYGRMVSGATHRVGGGRS